MKKEMKDNKTIIKNSGILYVKLVFTSLIGLYTSRTVLESLGASDFGIYSVVGGIVVMVNILNIALISTTYRYIAFEIGQGNLSGTNKVFNISLILHIVLALFLVLLAETFGRYYIYNKLNVPLDRIDDAIFQF